MRKLGWRVEVASINPPNLPKSLLAAAENEEIGRTFYVKKQSLFFILWAFIISFLSHPISFLKGFIYALGLGGIDLKQIVFNFFYFLEALLVGVWLARLKINHLHVHFLNPASTVGLLVSKIFPVTLSLTVHGPDEFYDIGRNYVSQKVSAASFLCCISNFARAQLMRISPPQQWEKLKLLPLGVDLAFFSSVKRESNSVAEILCVGRLVPSKGQSLLIEAVSNLVQLGKKVRLRLVGEGGDRHKLQQMIMERQLSDYVVLEGGVNQENIFSYYAAADLFVLPSFAEGLPVVLMEAMAMRIPCISTWVAGVPELIRHEIDGLLVPPADIDALTEALLRLIDDPLLKRRLGDAGRLRIEEKYNLSTNTRRLAAVFERGTND